MIFTQYKGSLKHTKTRLAYTYCPFCRKTTKDYGGKKHLYNKYSTLISDVWRDININFNFNELPLGLIERLGDLFGLPEYETINIYDERENFKKIEHKIFLFYFLLVKIPI